MLNSQLESSFKLLREFLKNVNYDYKKLTDSQKLVITEIEFKDLIKKVKLSERPIDTRLTKVLVVVDYVNDFVNGSLGSKAAQDIEDEIVKKLDESINYDKSKYKEVYVIFVCDMHSTSYLSTREGRHIPVEHCIVDTKGAELYGKVNKWYKSHKNRKNVFMVTKYAFGCNNLTEDIDRCVSISMDKIGYLMNDEDINSENLAKTMEPGISYKNRSYDWNKLYDTYQNLGQKLFVPDEVELVGVATNICVLANAVCLQTSYPEAEIYVDENAVASYDESLHNKALDIMESMTINVTRKQNNKS